MNGWRAVIVAGDFVSCRGEVTGFDHDDWSVWVVPDGEAEPVQLPWEDVRPA